MSEGSKTPDGGPPEDRRAVAAREDEEISAERSDEPPVVARLMVEIRSDGSRTIARGALDDAQTGQQVAVEAQGDSPLELAASLAKVIARAPLLATAAARSLRAADSRTGEGGRRPSLARRVARRVRRAIPRR